MDKTQKINRDYYNKNADEWAANKTHTFYAETQFRKFVPYLKKGSKVLDIGCGFGREIPLFLGIGRKLRYEGLDISPKFLHIAKSRYPQLKFHQGNLLELKTLPRKYDGFWAASTLQHIPEKDWSKMLENLEKITKKGAVGYFSLPEDRPNPASDRDPRHFTLLTKTHVQRIFTERGWKLLEKSILPGTRGTTVWRGYIYKLP